MHPTDSRSRARSPSSTLDHPQITNTPPPAPRRAPHTPRNPQQQLSQTYFRLAAILILECNDNGALGIILNRPTEHSLKDVQFTSSDQQMALFKDNRLWLGGDVGESSVIVLTTSSAVADATQIAAGIRVCTIAAAAAAVAAGRAAPDEFRFFACYSGWGPGQLQRECKAGVW
jgi:putative transcriptional regulator